MECSTVKYYFKQLNKIISKKRHTTIIICQYRDKNRNRARFPYSQSSEKSDVYSRFAHKYACMCSTVTVEPITLYFRGRKISRKMNLKYFREKIFSRIYCSRENIFPRKYLPAKISSRENILSRKYLPAKISSRDLFTCRKYVR